jgi:hypothetical protein
VQLHLVCGWMVFCHVGILVLKLAKKDLHTIYQRMTASSPDLGFLLHIACKENFQLHIYPSLLSIWPNRGD